jgi:hypothetical protein
MAKKATEDGPLHSISVEIKDRVGQHIGWMNLSSHMFNVRMVKSFTYDGKTLTVTINGA